MFSITENILDLKNVYDIVANDKHGAIATFAGVVRNNSGVLPTSYLVYEAYAPMAEKKMSQIGTEARDRWPIGGIAIQHRIGRVEIGEISVVIGVGSAHRKEALEACHYAIDRLKDIVPIWKKEYGPDGSFWVEGPKNKEYR